MRSSKGSRKGRPPLPRHGAHRAEGPRERPENWLYGLHAVGAALANPRRKVHRLLLTARAAQALGPKLPAGVRLEPAEPEAIARLLPQGAVHQGAALSCEPLPPRELDEILGQSLLSLKGQPTSEAASRRIVLVLDQLCDPHNVGAILRTAAAFGATAVVVQDRHAPPPAGALAKAASGAMEIVPYVEVVNITRALDKLAEAGFWRIALAGDGAESLAQAASKGDVALVLGSEGEGIRRLVREHCDTSAFIPITGAMESLNVSNAAAIALYEMRRR